MGLWRRVVQPVAGQRLLDSAGAKKRFTGMIDRLRQGS